MDISDRIILSIFNVDNSGDVMPFSPGYFRKKCRRECDDVFAAKRWCHDLSFHERFEC